jgi:hypothetical protein
MRADVIAIETSKTSKVTAVVVVMRIICKMKCNSRSANPENKKLSCQKPESVDFPEEKSHKPRNLLLKTRKGWLPKKLAPEFKKLVLNSTNLKLTKKHA